jgi:putative membrane protein
MVDAVVTFLLNWLVLSVAFLITAKVVPGIRLSGLWDAIVVAAIFGVLNFFLGKLLYLFFGIVTLGVGFLLSFLLHWFVNAILLKITDALTSRLEVRGFGTALVGALVMSLLGRAGIYVVNMAMHPTHPGSVYI